MAFESASHGLLVVVKSDPIQLFVNSQFQLLNSTGFWAETNAADIDALFHEGAFHQLMKLAKRNTDDEKKSLNKVRFTTFHGIDLLITCQQSFLYQEEVAIFGFQHLNGIYEIEKTKQEEQPVLICRYNTELEITFVNKEYADAFGLDLATLVGKKITDFIDPSDHDEIVRLIQLYKLSKKPQSNLQKVSVVGGELRWHEWSDQLFFDDNGELREIQASGRDITMHRKILVSLESSQLRFRDLVNSIPVGVYEVSFADDGGINFHFVSKRWCEMNAVTEETILANPHITMELIHPEDLEGFMFKNIQSIKTVQAFEWSGRMVIDGNVRYMKINSTPRLLAGDQVRWTGVQMDITEQKMAEAKLKELAIIASNTSDAILLTDIDYHIKWVNDSFLALNHAEREIVIGGNYFDFFGKWEANRVSLSRQRSSQHNRVLLYGEGKNSEGYWVDTFVLPIQDEEDNYSSFLIVMHNVSDRVAYEKQLEETLDLVKNQNSRLLNFSHIVSHDIRAHSSNLTSLVSFLSNFEDTFTSDMKMGFSMLGQTTSKLAETIGHLSEIIDINKSKDLLFKRINLCDQVEETIKSLQILIQETNCTIHNHIPNSAFVNAVSAYLDSIVLNLLTNAIKYRQLDRSPVIEVSFDEGPTEKVLMVSDNGMGMDLNIVGDKLFGMYKTFHGNKDARGIGLYTIKNQIEAMKGRIEVQSEVGKGSVFKVYFNG